MNRTINKILFLIIVIFTISMMSCIETNYPQESTGIFIVYNEASSGKTITRIDVTTSGGTSTYYRERVNIQPGGKSKEIGVELSYSEYISKWNQFRIVVTLSDNSTVFLDVTMYEDIKLVLRYNGTSLVKD